MMTPERVNVGTTDALGPFGTVGAVGRDGSCPHPLTATNRHIPAARRMMAILLLFNADLRCRACESHRLASSLGLCGERVVLGRQKPPPRGQGILDCLQPISSGP